MHFDSSGVAAGSAFPAGVAAAAQARAAALDALGGATAAQAQALQAALQQVEAYAAELAALQERYTRAEQQLRHAAQPHQAPRDPEAQHKNRQVSQRPLSATGSSLRGRHRFATPRAVSRPDR